MRVEQKAEHVLFNCRNKEKSKNKLYRYANILKTDIVDMLRILKLNSQLGKKNSSDRDKTKSLICTFVKNI